MPRQTPPKHMATRLSRLLRPERPDYAYLKKVFQHTRALLAVHPVKPKKRLPELLTDRELMAFYEAVWQARNPIHMVMVKLLLLPACAMRNSPKSVCRMLIWINDRFASGRGKGGKIGMCYYRAAFGESWRSISKGCRSGAQCISLVESLAPVFHASHPADHSCLRAHRRNAKARLSSSLPPPADHVSHAQRHH